MSNFPLYVSKSAIYWLAKNNANTELAYNRSVPTPFYHLSIAEELLAETRLPERIRATLHAQADAFTFGNTAPDVQTISGQKRAATHFFNVPLTSNTPPWEKILAKHPRLAQAAALSPTQAAFMVGYLCHLQADWFWVKDLFLPTFGLKAKWGHFRQRLFLHNVLRIYMDEEAVAGLPARLNQRLNNVQPDQWLPFTVDNDLTAWRDFLAEQLQPGSGSQTIEVFAERMGTSVAEINALLRSETRLQAELFVHIAPQALVEYRQHLITANIALITAYLTPGDKT